MYQEQYRQSTVQKVKLQVQINTGTIDFNLHWTLNKIYTIANWINMGFWLLFGQK